MIQDMMKNKAEEVLVKIEEAISDSAKKLGENIEIVVIKQIEIEVE